jgi:eukaryotic-like serine/threonine-protein kinase
MIQVGQTVGNYKITAKLGEGGMGLVYLAEHPKIGRKVALKAIHPELARNAEVVSRFETEARAVNQIGNEHIVDVSDFGKTSDDEYYFIMEFLQGESLADRLRRERLLPAARALHIASQVADALAASHAHGIIHRDLKPENIYLINRGQTPDFVKVLDFGLAKLTQGEEKVSHKTRTGSVMGTPYYMSPEQCEGKANIDHRADIYSLGVILFEMLTGRVPFGGEGYGEIIVKHLTTPAPAPREINPAITPAEQAVVLRALQKSRDTRFSSMGEFNTAIQDPERFAGNAPGDAPVAVKTGDVSSSLSLRGPAEHSDVRRVPMPSTFRHAGEVMDEEMEIPRSRKGLVIGVVTAVAVAGVAALFVMKKNSGDETMAAQTAPAAPTVAPAAPSPPAAPAAPARVKVSFSSEPLGATVVSRSTGETLGTTPFEREFPQGREQLDFLFKKESFEDGESTFVPESPGVVRASLRPARTRGAATAEATDEGRKPSTATSRSSARSKSKGPKKPAAPGVPGRPLDDDAVLEPSFKF